MRASATWSCVAIIVLAITACGGGTRVASGRSSTSDAELAAKIRRSAQRYEKEQERTDTVPRTMTVKDASALPAGSDEIDGAATKTRGQALLSAGDRVSFQRLAGQLGSIGIAASPVGVGQKVVSAGSLRTGVAWSTSKAPVAMAAISAGTARATDLTEAITASDNAAAERLWASLGGGDHAAAAADAQLRAAGDSRTRIQASTLRQTYTPFGQTDWRLTDQVRFTAGMGCTSSGRQVLGLMSQAIPGQRWGLGSTGFPAKLKGGWGPGVTPGQGDGWLDRQMGIVTIRGKPIALAIASSTSGHDAGTRNLTAIAKWAVAHLDVRSAPARAAC